MELDRTEARVLGAMIEKRWTTPEQYPLSMNALVSACNQKSNRDPVMDLAEFEIAGCLLGLRPKGLALVHERDGGRVPRYGEKLMDELGVSKKEIAILAELLLRGDQTGGELFRRCGRMAHYANQGEMDAMLRDLAGRRFVRLQPKESGQRYPRWTQLLCLHREPPPDEDDVEDDAPRQTTPAASTTYESPAVAGTGAQIGIHAVAQAAAPAASAPMNAPAPTPVMGTAKITEDTVTVSDTDAIREELDALRNEVRTLRERVETLEELV